ncbi:hypothetical protein [Methylobacterium sp. A54F]
MRSARRAACAAGALLAVLVGPAHAQEFYDAEILSPRAVAWRLSERGFSEIGRPRFDGRAYVVEAVGPGGNRVRLFVDAEDGAILGRQRLDGPPPVRLARPAPGFGWTEDEAGPRRYPREAERLLPPADIPYPEGRALPRAERSGADPYAGGPPRAPRPQVATRGDLPAARPDGLNPQGLNPDAKGQPEGAEPRRATRAPAGRPADAKAAPRLAPEAPRPKPVEAAKIEAPKVEAPKSEANKPDPAGAEAKPAAAVAAVAPPKAEPAVPNADKPKAAMPADKPAETKPAETKAAEAKPEGKPAAEWKDPPAEGKRPVRVIGGATIVPGGSDKDGGQ